MPRIDGEKMLAHIKSKAGRVKCSICRRGPITFSDTIRNVPEGWMRSDMDQKIMRLVVPLYCENCGGISLISAFAAGDDAVIEDENPTNKVREIK